MAKHDDTFEKSEGLEKDDESAEPKKRAPSSRRKKSEVFTDFECTNKIFQVYNLVGRFMKSSKSKKEKDFEEEGKALARLTDKYEIVGFIMKMSDPVFLVLGLINKFGDHFQEYAARKKEEREAKQQQETVQPFSFGAVQNNEQNHIA